MSVSTKSLVYANSGLLVAFLGLLALMPSGALARAPWKGPRREPPTETPRPQVPTSARAIAAPLAVHAEAGVSAENIRRALAALERAEGWMRSEGWPSPVADGGLGEGEGFDLYLLKAHPEGDAVYADAAVLWSELDAVSAFAVVEERQGAELEERVLSLYVQAVLLGLDPAEAESWRRATACWLLRHMDASARCGGALRKQQREPWRSWIAFSAGGGAGGAILLEFLSWRLAAGGSTWLRDLWHFARQYTWDAAAGLRGSPDLWAALEQLLKMRGLRIEEMMEELARFRIDPGRRMESLPPIYRQWNIDTQKMPIRLANRDPALQSYGSAYAYVDLRRAELPQELRIWLRGEYGVRWSLAAIRVGEHGELQGALSTPLRESHQAYLPVQRTPGLSGLWLVVTNMSNRRPDADISDENLRSFQLILDAQP